MKRMTDNTINENILQPLNRWEDDYGNPYYETNTGMFVFGPAAEFQSEYLSDNWGNEPWNQVNAVYGQIYAQNVRTSAIRTNSEGLTMYNNSLAQNGWKSWFPQIISGSIGTGDSMQSTIEFRLSANHGNKNARMRFMYNGITWDNKTIVNNNQYKIHSIAVVSTDATKPAYVFFQITDGMLKNGTIQSLLDLYNYINQGDGHMLCTGCIGGKQIVGIYENKFVFADGTSSTKEWNKEIIDNGTFTIKDNIRAGV